MVGCSCYIPFTISPVNYIQYFRKFLKNFSRDTGSHMFMAPLIIKDKKLKEAICLSTGK